MVRVITGRNSEWKVKVRRSQTASNIFLTQKNEKEKRKQICVINKTILKYPFFYLFKKKKKS